MKKILLLLFITNTLLSNPIPKLFNDKNKHSTVGAWIGSTTYYWNYKITDRIAFSWGTGVTNAFIAGTIKEIYDCHKPHKTGFNKDDLALTTLGGYTGCFVTFIILDIKRKDKLEQESHVRAARNL